jgi:SAM-dependent methyltransferase
LTLAVRTQKHDAQNPDLSRGKAPTLLNAFRSWWRDQRRAASVPASVRRFGSIAWEFVRDSLPDRKRQRYGDVDFDWQYRVNTTSGGVGWRARLIGLLTSSYQPMEQELFCEMLNGLGIDYSGFTFIDIGSGKGRALLMASAYPFRRILGIELLPELNEIAKDNIRRFANREQRCENVETICGDATAFEFPAEPLVVYLFHPLPEAGFLRVIDNIQWSWREHRRTVWVVYANPIFEGLLANREGFHRAGGTHQYCLFELRDSNLQHG